MSKQVIFQSAATTTGNGTSHSSDGFLSAQYVEIAETAGGTATVVLEGSFDGTNWYALGYQRADAQATLTRAVIGISVTANLRSIYQVLDAYPEVRARISAIAGGGTITAKGYLV